MNYVGWSLVILVVIAAGTGLYNRAASRACPRCGRRVPRGRLDCAACGFDFRAIG